MVLYSSGLHSVGIYKSEKGGMKQQKRKALNWALKNLQKLGCKEEEETAVNTT